MKFNWFKSERYTISSIPIEITKDMIGGGVIKVKVPMSECSPNELSQLNFEFFKKNVELQEQLHEAHESIARLRTMHDKVYKENKGLKKSYPTFKSLLELGIDKTAELVNKELVEENETLRQAYQTLNPDVYCKNILDELSEEKLHNDRQTGLILNLEKKIQSLKDKHDTLEHWIKGLFDMVQYDKADKTPYKDAVQAMEFIRENYGDLLDCCTKQEETIANITKPVMPDKTGIIKGKIRVYKKVKAPKFKIEH